MTDTSTDIPPIIVAPFVPKPCRTSRGHVIFIFIPNELQIALLLCLKSHGFTLASVNKY